MARLRFETDLGTSLKASADLSAAYDKVGDQLGKAAGEAKRLELAAKRIVDQNLTPQERYNQKIEKMAQAVKAGKLSMDDAERTAGRLRQRLDEVNNKGKETFGTVALQRIGAYTAGLFGVSQMVGKIVEGFRAVEAESQAAADAIFQNLGSFGELQQVSSTPQDFAQNVARAREIVRSGIVPAGQQGQAADIVFAMVSAGYTEAEKDLIQRLGEQKFVKPEGLLGLAEGLQKYRRLFGEGEAGTLSEVANKVVQASSTAQASVPETLKAILESGASAKALGIGDEAAVAAFLAVEAQSASADLAATKFRSFLDQVNKRGLFKGDIPSTVAAIQEREARGENLFKILGETRAVQAFQDISGQSDFMAQQLRTVTTAPQRDLIGTQSRLLETDPILRAGKALTQAKGEAESEAERFSAERELLLDTIRARRKASRADYNIIDRVGKTIADWVVLGGADLFQAERAAIQAATDPSYSGATEEERKIFIDYLKRTAESNERMERSTAPPPSGRQE